MKIRVSTVPSSGMKIDAPIPLEPLNLRLNEGSRAADIVFTAAPNADLTVTKTLGGAEVKGIVSAPCQRLCATCAENVPNEVIAEVSWFLQNTDETVIEGMDGIDDPGVLTYTGDHIDLEDALQEALILQLTPFWHPERDEQQRCTGCKRVCGEAKWSSSETETPSKRTLGALLESAQAKKRK
jgi:hypothetical protein